ncbi:MAG TPA: hypothetical protein VM534_09365 [Thermoanaerobaculia bacterium]|nr:hypothetical protein [Thermoanaerobaculia bacterium]
MTLVNSLCAEINVFGGVGEPTGLVVEKSALRGRQGLCKSMRELANKTRVLGDGFYYIPVDLWPGEQAPVVIHKQEWTVISSLSRSRRRTPKGKTRSKHGED